MTAEEKSPTVLVAEVASVARGMYLRGIHRQRMNPPSLLAPWRGLDTVTALRRLSDRSNSVPWFGHGMHWQSSGKGRNQFALQFSQLSFKQLRGRHERHQRRVRLDQIQRCSYIVQQVGQQPAGLGQLAQLSEMLSQARLSATTEVHSFARRARKHIVQTTKLLGNVEISKLVRGQARAGTRQQKKLAKHRALQYDEAIRLEGELDVDSATAVLRELVLQQPNNALYTSRLSKVISDQAFMDGVSKEESRRLCTEAMQLADKAIELDPQLAASHAAACVSRGRLAVFTPGARQKMALATEALYRCRDAVAVDPKDDLVNHLQGKWHQEMAGLPRIIRAAANAFLGGDLPPGNYQDAEACFRAAVATRPDRLVHRVELGRTLDRMGRWDEAREQLMVALDCPIEDINAELQRRDAHRLLDKLPKQSGAGGKLWESARKLDAVSVQAA